jgi:hypothetical protein
MDDDIAISSVVDLVGRDVRASAGGGEGDAAATGQGSPGLVVERFESLHQRVASAASGSAPPQPGALRARLRRAGLWAAAATAVVAGLAAWLRPERVMAERKGEEGGREELSWFKVAGVGLAAGLVVGGLDLLGTMKQQNK